MDPKTAYLCYDERWMLELVFRQYKNDQCLDKTNVQGDFSLIGSESINFIATVATCRMIGKAREAGLLSKMSYKDLMDDLSSAWRMVDSPEQTNFGYILSIVYSKSLKLSGYQYRLPDRSLRIAAGSGMRRQNKKLSVRVVVRG